MRFLIPALLIIGSFLLSCSKDKQQTPDPKIVGQWQWQSQSIGSAANTSTPQSTGITETLSISSNQTWTKSQNSTVVSSGQFRTSIETNTRGAKVNAIHYRMAGRSTDSTAYYQVTNNVLTFSNDFMNGVGGGVRTYTKQ